MNLPPLKIGIQGVRASFHDVAARKFFAGREILPVECRTFKALCLALESHEADYCVMAIENTIAGSILPNYSLLERHGFKILGETYLRIELCLLALPGQREAELQTVQSHPMALAQCEEALLELKGARLIESSDTAQSAKDISEKKLTGHAAIASRFAAETYGLAVLREGIETNKKNYTRFLVICRSAEHKRAPAADKTSIRFEAPHRPGSLVEVLDIFRRFEVNLTKIQSVPILGRPYEYGFHVDLEWEDAARYDAAMRELGGLVHRLIHFGEYPRGGGILE